MTLLRGQKDSYILGGDVCKLYLLDLYPECDICVYRVFHVYIHATQDLAIQLETRQNKGIWMA